MRCSGLLISVSLATVIGSYCISDTFTVGLLLLVLQILLQKRWPNGSSIGDTFSKPVNTANTSVSEVSKYVPAFLRTNPTKVGVSSNGVVHCRPNAIITVFHAIDVCSILSFSE